ncbi:MAG: hypothetical protein ACTSVV_08305 [Promethearchaeota archaeon]
MSIDPESLKYDIKPTLIAVLIVAALLIIVFVFWPLIFALITGNVDGEEPSERLHGSLSLFKIILNMTYLTMRVF